MDRKQAIRVRILGCDGRGERRGEERRGEERRGEERRGEEKEIKLVICIYQE